jgi:hypothetical protein
MGTIVPVREGEAEGNALGKASLDECITLGLIEKESWSETIRPLAREGEPSPVREYTTSYLWLRLEAAEAQGHVGYDEGFYRLTGTPDHVMKRLKAFRESRPKD